MRLMAPQILSACRHDHSGADLVISVRGRLINIFRTIGIDWCHSFRVQVAKHCRCTSRCFALHQPAAFTISYHFCTFACFAIEISFYFWYHRVRHWNTGTVLYAEYSLKSRSRYLSFVTFTFSIKLPWAAWWTCRYFRHMACSHFVRISRRYSIRHCSRSIRLHEYRLAFYDFESWWSCLSAVTSVARCMTH